jgi:hypothetical protein
MEPTGRLTADLAQGGKVELTLLGRLLRVIHRSSQLNLFEYWPVEWVTLERLTYKPRMTFLKVVLLILLFAAAAMLSLALFFSYHEYPGPDFVESYSLPGLIAWIGTILALPMIMIHLWLRWNRPLEIISVILAGQLTDRVGFNLLVPADADESFWPFLQRLHGFRTQETDLTYNDSIMPFRLTSPTWAAWVKNIPAAGVLFLFGGGGAGVAVARSYSDYHRLSEEAKAIYVYGGAAVGAAVLLGIYSLCYFYPFLLGLRHPKGCRQAQHLINRFQPQDAIALLDSRPDARKAAEGLRLLILASLMLGDLQRALGVCAELSQLDAELGEFQLQVIQAYRPLFLRMAADAGSSHATEIKTIDTKPQDS